MASCLLERGALTKADMENKEAQKQKISALRNAMKRDTVMGIVQKNGGIGNALETLRSLLRGSNKLGAGARDSVESKWHGRSSQWISAVDNELYKSGVKKIAISGALDKDISVAMFKLSKGQDAGKGPAAAIAKIYSKALDSMRDFVNGVGGDIGDAKGYVTTTEHDPVKLRRAAGDNKTPDQAFKAWWDFSKSRMDDYTFRGVTPNAGETLDQAKERFARDIFDSLVTGVHMKSGGVAEGALSKDFLGTANVQKKISAHRAILWKDGESWHEYQQQFGRSPTLNAAIMHSLDRGSRSMALMEKFGDNPGAQLNMIANRIQETYKGDIDAIGKFQNGLNGVKNEMGYLDGTLNIPANMGIAGFGNAVRAWESMSSLGSVGVTHFASIWPTVTSELAHHGINRISALGNMIKSLTVNLSDKDLHDIHSDLGSFADGIVRHDHSIIGDDSIPGRVSNLAGKFMDYTGIHYLFDHTKAGIRDMLASNLGRNISKTWEELEPHLSNMLSKYGIGKDEWSLIRNLKDLPTFNGRQYLTPSSVSGVDAQGAESLLRARGTINDAEKTIHTDNAGIQSEKYGLKTIDQHVGDFRQEIADKLLSYYNDAAAHGVVQAGVREKALLLQGTKAGTGAGEMMRFLAQFKMWPVAAMHQILEREIYMSLSKSEAAWNIGKIIALGVPAGYLRMAISDMVGGRPLRDPTKPETLLAAAAQSGGLGVLGDFLFGETSRMGGGLVATLGGPVISDADFLVHIFNEWKQGNAGWPDLAHFAVRHIPFASLVYLKGALDYMLWYHLYSAASPNWWERTNRRLEKEQGRAMTGYMPGAGVPWGVPGVYLKNSSGQSSGVFGNGQLQTQH